MGLTSEHRISLQYDGGHHSDPRQIKLDATRRATTERLGWTEIRVFKEDLDGDKPFVLEKVRAVTRRGTKGRVRTYS
jgi:very-short-patch-repair endonuclease